MKTIKLTILAAAMAGSFSALAQTTAITNATVYTAGEQGVLKDASILIEDGTIVAINPEQISADEIIDAQDAIVTPGFIGSMNTLGLVEVGAVSGSRDADDKKATMTFDPSYAFNPRSTLIPYARKGGITTDVIIPHGGEDIFKGVASLVSLSGEFDSVLQKNVALFVEINEKSDGSRALSIQNLISTLSAHQERDEKEGKEDDKSKLLDALFAKDMPLLVHVSRASDMLELLKIKQQFDINMVFAGAQDATVIAEQLATEQVPVIISSMDNLPGNFSSMHAALDNAGKLEKAGVKVLLTIAGDGSHNLYQLRYDAGNAVSQGMSQEGALQAISKNVADVFNINAGEIAPGKRADLLMWSDDPFEYKASLQGIWINGEKVSTESRQDKLRDRYMSETDMPRGYTK